MAKTANSIGEPLPSGDTPPPHLSPGSTTTTLTSDPNPTTPTTTSQHGTPHILYSIRWLLLVLFSLVTAWNAFLWIAFAPRLRLWLDFFELDHPFYVNLFSVVFMLAFPVFFLPSMSILNHREHGVWRGVMAGTWLQTLGALLRWVGCLPSVGPREGYWIVLTGQLLAAIAQIFVLAIPPKLASLWFGQRERNTACSIGIAANSMGIALGWVHERWCHSTNDDDSFLGALFFPNELDEKEAEARIVPYMMVQFLGCLLVSAACTFLFRSQPPTPPSHSTALEYQEVADRCKATAGHSKTDNGHTVVSTAKTSTPTRPQPTEYQTISTAELSGEEHEEPIASGRKASPSASSAETDTLLPSTGHSFSASDDIPIETDELNGNISDAAITTPATFSRSQTMRDIRALWHRPAFVPMLVSTGIGMGANFTFATVLDELLGPIFPEFKNSIAILGFAFVLVGIVSTLLCGWFLDQSLRYRATLRATHILAFLALLAIHLHLSISHGWLSSTDSFGVVAILVMVYGASINAIMPASFQYSSELFYPISDLLMSVLLNTVSSVVSSVLIAAMSWLDRTEPTSGVGDFNSADDGLARSRWYTMDDAMLVLVVWSGLGVVSSFFVHGKLLRWEQDSHARLLVEEEDGGR